MFSTTTTDSDPGAGTIRLNSSPQDGSTQAYVDLLDALGEDWTQALDDMDASSNPNRGYLRIVSRDDATKWLLFRLTGVTTATGYRKLDLDFVDGSDADPFGNGDAVFVHFSPAGDVGPGITANSGIVVIIGDGTNVISPGEQGDVEVPFDCEIQTVSLKADVPGDFVVDIWRSTYAALPAADGDSITGGNEPELTADLTYQDSTLTGWTTTLTAGDWLTYNVDSAATVTRVTVSLVVVRS